MCGWGCEPLSRMIWCYLSTLVTVPTVNHGTIMRTDNMFVL